MHTGGWARRRFGWGQRRKALPHTGVGVVPHVAARDMTIPYRQNDGRAVQSNHCIPWFGEGRSGKNGVHSLYKRAMVPGIGA